MKQVQVIKHKIQKKHIALKKSAGKAQTHRYNSILNERVWEK
jgi:hypothetical protein